MKICIYSYVIISLLLVVVVKTMKILEKIYYIYIYIYI